MDVSFISQTLILPAIAAVLPDGGELVSLIKPQFEAGRAAIGKGGIVRSDADRAAAVRRVTECAEALGLTHLGTIPSPIRGGDGNIEYLAHFKKEKKEG
jgi:23S rRNA (cytidine1920-2'-O)/16S rRNA (cytidine1409-2'-O)-methyltransferase